MTFGPGSIVAGRYHADRLVGTGGMGEVWAGEHVTVGNKVALKRLLPAAAQHHEVVTRFRREAVLLGKIRSDHVARVVDFIDDQTFGPVLVMEFIEGPSLAQILEDRAISVEEAVDLSSDLAVALCDLHDAKIVHRDLKPGNIIMQPQPNGRLRAVIVDFGIGRQLSGKGPEEVTGITRANIALGTVEYMAPEQILNSRDVTPLSDVYAVGAILYRSVAGVHAFGAKRGEELARAKLIDEAPRLNIGRTDEVARAFADLVARCLKKRPAQRYASAAELRAAVAEITERMEIAEMDLDSTTADTHLFRHVANEASPPTPYMPSAPPGPMPAARKHPEPPRPAGARASMPSIPEPHPSVRGSIPSISDAGAPMRGSMPSISEVHGPGMPPPSLRGSMPSISDSRGPLSQGAPLSQGVPTPRGSLPSIPDFGGDGHAMGRPSLASLPPIPEPPVAPAMESMSPGGVGKKTVGLAVLTAFAVGAAVGLVLAPTSAPAPKLSAAAPSPSAVCSCPAAVASVAALSPSLSTSSPDATAAASAAPSASVASSGLDSAKPSTAVPPPNPVPAPALPKPTLTGHMPDGAWTPPTSQPKPAPPPPDDEVPHPPPATVDTGSP